MPEALLQRVERKVRFQCVCVLLQHMPSDLPLTGVDLICSLEAIQGKQAKCIQKLGSHQQGRGMF